MKQRVALARALAQSHAFLMERTISPPWYRPDPRAALRRLAAHSWQERKKEEKDRSFVTHKLVREGGCLGDGVVRLPPSPRDSGEEFRIRF